jgi:uncharacterized protein (DUF1330 family)
MQQDPARQAGRERFLVRGITGKAHEAGFSQRGVTIEFDSVPQAMSTYQRRAHQQAARVLEGSVERDI